MRKRIGCGCFLKSRSQGAAAFNAGTRALVFYFTFIAFLISIVMVNQRSHNDTWILGGIFIPTLMFVFIFCVVETFVTSSRKIAILTASFLVVLNLIPGFKYQLFRNPYDSTIHFRFTNEIDSLGHVPETGPGSKYYSSNPGMHILMSSLSVVSAIPINDIFRFVIPAISGLVPLIVLFVTNDVFPEEVQRYCIVASAFPLSTIYNITGTSLSIVVYFLFFAVYLRRLLTGKNGREYTTIFIVLGFTLIISHAVTPVVAAFLLIGMPLGLKILHALLARGLPRFPASSYLFPALLHLVMLMAWWANLATINLNTFVNYIKEVLSPTGFMEMPAVPARVFEVPLWAQVRVFLVFNIRYAIVAALSLLGLLVFLRMLGQERLSGKNKSFYLHVLVLIGMIVAYLLFMVGFGLALLQYQRFIVYLIPFCIFLIGFVLWRLNISLGNVFSRIELRNLTLASLLFVLVSLSLISFFPCQPLVPRASVLGKDFSENDYLVETNLVNTVYQKEMISFADVHSSEARIASDVVTRWQIRGFSSRSFSSRHIFFSPLEPHLDRELEWELFLLHTRKAGPFNEQVEYRTTEIIENLRTEAGNLIYDNGESFIISQLLHNLNRD